MIGLSGEIPLVSHSDVTSPFPPSGNGGYASNRDDLYYIFTVIDSYRQKKKKKKKKHGSGREWESFFREWNGIFPQFFRGIGTGRD